MMPVENANPWPANQRFDFVVRTRKITNKEAKAWQLLARKSKQRGHVSPYKRAVHKALIWLTGHDAPPSAEAWRKLVAVQ